MAGLLRSISYPHPHPARCLLLCSHHRDLCARVTHRRLGCLMWMNMEIGHLALRTKESVGHACGCRKGGRGERTLVRWVRPGSSHGAPVMKPPTCAWQAAWMARLSGPQQPGIHERTVTRPCLGVSLAIDLTPNAGSLYGSGRQDARLEPGVPPHHASMSRPCRTGWHQERVASRSARQTSVARCRRRQMLVRKCFLAAGGS